MTLRIIREKHSSQSTSLNGDELALFYRRELDIVLEEYGLPCVIT